MGGHTLSTMILKMVDVTDCLISVFEYVVTRFRNALVIPHPMYGVR
jgi:hypothetical protein